MFNVLYVILINFFYVSSVLSFNEEEHKVNASGNVLNNLAMKYASFKEEVFYIAEVDFNFDGYRDLFVATSNSSGYKLYLAELKAPKDRGEKKHSDDIAFYRLIPGSLGLFFDRNSFVYVRELGKFGVVFLVAKPGGCYEKKLSYLNNKQNKLFTEVVSNFCDDKMEPNKKNGSKKYTMEIIFKGEPTYISKHEDNLQFGVEIKKVLDRKIYQKLPSINTMLEKNYKIGRLVNHNISTDIFRIYDESTGDFLGYYDNLEKNFVSLNILDLHYIKVFNASGANFKVKERFGNKPVLRLKKAPEETPGSIVGGPLDKQIDVGGKLTDKPDEAQNKTDKVEKIVVEQKNKNGK